MLRILLFKSMMKPCNQRQFLVLSVAQTSDPPIKSGTSGGSEADNQSDISSTLDRADHAMDAMKTWESTVGLIKLVMDTVSPIPEVWPIPISACPLLSLLLLFS